MIVVDGDRTTAVEGVATDTTILLEPAALEAATGWDLQPQGLCRGNVCVPRRDGDGLVIDERVDLVAFASALRRPIACEPAAGIAVLGESVEDQAAAIAGRTAPPFTLLDLDGRPVSLTDFGGRKKLLLAWASW